MSGSMRGPLCLVSQYGLWNLGILAVGYSAEPTTSVVRFAVPTPSTQRKVDQFHLKCSGPLLKHML